MNNGGPEKGSRVGYEEEDRDDALAALRGARLLLVEDNEINRQVVQDVLKRAGLKVDLAKDGLEAVEAVAKKKYDAILMDIQMPVMDGYTATRKIRELEERERRTDNRRQKEEGRGRRAEGKAQWAEDRGQKAEDRRQREEGKGLGKREGENRKSEIGMRNAESEPVAHCSQQPGDRKQKKEGEGLGRREDEKKSEIRDPKSKIEDKASVLSPQNSELEPPGSDVHYPVSSNQHPTSSIQHPASSIQHPASSIRYRIPNNEYLTPIIAMTGLAMAGDEEKSLAAGMNDHITKPVDLKQLYTTLLKWIQPRKNQV